MAFIGGAAPDLGDPAAVEVVAQGQRKFVMLELNDAERARLEEVRDELGQEWRRRVGKAEALQHT